MISKWAGVTAVAALGVLSGCGGDSSLNPFTWFQSEPEAETLSIVELRQRTETRPLIPEITDLAIERVPGGIIVRATGLPDRQGWYDAQLVVEESTEAGVLTYSFRARPPETPTPVSTEWSREIVAAAQLSDIELAGISRIQVAGARNVRVARR